MSGARRTSVGVPEDRALRDVGLREEEPVPPLEREPRVRAIEVLRDGDAVGLDEPGHRLGVIHRDAHRDERTAVVTDHREARMAERPHHADDVARHRPLRVRRVIRRRRRLRGATVPAEVGTYDG